MKDRRAGKRFLRRHVLSETKGPLTGALFRSRPTGNLPGTSLAWARPMPHGPRLLLVPTVTEVEWAIKPLLEEWAEVASFDAPGGWGRARPPSDHRGGDRRSADLPRSSGADGRDCVVVGDEAGAAQAVRIAAATPETVTALALGHSGRFPSSERAASGAQRRCLRCPDAGGAHRLPGASSAPSGQLTQHAYDDEMADRYMERVPQEVALGYLEHMLSAREAEQLEPTLRSLGVPLLLVEHCGCIGWTAESFEDAVAAFPDAATASVEIKPSGAPEFVEILKGFCEGLPERTETAPAERAS